MTNSPDDYRDPKITTAPAKTSATSIIAWLLLALGILVLLAWLFGAFDRNDTVAPDTTTPAIVNEQPVTPPVNDTPPVETTVPADTTPPVDTTTPADDTTPADGSTPPANGTTPAN